MVIFVSVSCEFRRGVSLRVLLFRCRMRLRVGFTGMWLRVGFECAVAYYGGSCGGWVECRQQGRWESGQSQNLWVRTVIRW